MPANHPQHYELSEVLGSELEALRGAIPLRDAEGNEVSLDQRLQSWAAEGRQNRTEAQRDAAENAHLKELYDGFYRQDFAALCLSGGGIRSASISLGVIQALAEHCLLDKFHYLSTVSGGGYIGSWLSTWLKWSRNSAPVLDALKERRTNSDCEPEPIRHLRQYSAYLTPRSGMLSGDLWAPIAIIIRNLLLNWLILLPALALPTVVVKIFGALVHAAGPLSPIGFPARQWIALGVAILGLIFSALAFRFKLRRLYIDRVLEKPAWEEKRFLMRSLLPAICGAFLLTWVAGSGDALAASGIFSWLGWLTTVGITELVILFVCAVVAAEPRAMGDPVKNYLGWFCGALVWGASVWAGFYLYHRLGSSAQLALVILGPAWAMGAILLGQTVYTMVRSYSEHGDFEREWLGRAGGWYLLAALGWVVLAGIVLIGPFLFRHADEVIAYGKTWVTAVGAISGVATAFLGKSSLTGGTDSSSSWSGFVSNIGLKVAGPLFAAILLILLSVAFDAAALGEGFETAAFFSGKVGSTDDQYWPDWYWTLGVAGVLLVIMLIADFLVNVNRFSLHAVYRNRLIRCYLGAPHEIVTAPPHDKRKPDGFTGFDQADNIRLTELWSAGHSGWRPYHVINMTLNLASTRNLAWQERKAMSFIATAKFCGAADLGFRQTEEYGDPKGGMSLGTAMAISGAAINSNMGYHTSPTIAFLLTLLNVRLGWWLGNPGKAGDNLPVFRRRVKQQFCSGRRPVEPYNEDAPWFSLPRLLAEMFERTDEDSRYVFLSDGGHFEDFGLYEMVRRRCRLIVVVDGGQDAQRGFEDLGNAVRKIWIDLGVRIAFDKSALLQAEKDAKSSGIPYFAVGTIYYVSDGNPPPAAPPKGKILYLKPVVRGDEEAADVIAYKRANAAFPDQTTLNQWFDESQLESYRRLGHLMVDRIVNSAPWPFVRAAPTLRDLIDVAGKINQTTMSWP